MPFYLLSSSVHFHLKRFSFGCGIAKKCGGKFRFVGNFYDEKAEDKKWEE